MSALVGFSLTVSVLTRMELLAVPGITVDRSIWIDGFLSHCEEVSLLRSVQNEAVRIRREHKVAMVDAIITATVIVKGIPIITADKGLMKLAKTHDVRLFEP